MAMSAITTWWVRMPKNVECCSVMLDSHWRRATSPSWYWRAIRRREARCCGFWRYNRASRKSRSPYRSPRRRLPERRGRRPVSPAHRKAWSRRPARPPPDAHRACRCAHCRRAKQNPRPSRRTSPPASARRRVLRRTRQDRRRSPPTPPAAPRCSPRRSIPRCWREKFPRATARPPAAAGAWRVLVQGGRSWPLPHTESVGNQGHDTVQILQHLVVPEPQHAIPVRGKPAIPALIGQRIGMLAAVHLDDQPPFETDEVGDETPDGSLTAKLETCKAPIAQCKPQLAFGIGHALAQFPRPSPHQRVDGGRAGETPPLALSPCGRGQPRAQRAAG